MKTLEGAPYQSGNVLTSMFTHCVDCRFHIKRNIYTSDPFEHEQGIYCSKVPDKTESWERHTMGEGPTNFKLVVADDRDVDVWAKIPDWCPRVLDRIDAAYGHLLNHPEVLQRFEYMEGDGFPYDHSRRHAERVARLGDEFLQAYGSRSYEKDRRLLKIAALLHDLGRPNAYHGHASLSAQLAEMLIGGDPQLALTDKFRIIDAINRHSDGVGIDDPLAAALYIGDKLDISWRRFKHAPSNRAVVTLAEEMLKVKEEDLSPFDKQAYYTSGLHFRVETRAEKTKENPFPKPDTGVLVFEMKDPDGIKAHPEFHPELFADEEHLRLLTSCRDLAMRMLELKDFEIHVLRRGSTLFSRLGLEDLPEENIPFEKFMTPAEEPKEPKPTRAAKKDATKAKKPATKSTKAAAKSAPGTKAEKPANTAPKNQRTKNK